MKSRATKEAALKLRAEKKSYNEISKLLGVSKGTLHYWFRNNLMSKRVKAKLTLAARKKMGKHMAMMNLKAKEKREKMYEQKRREADILYKKFGKESLFISGLMIYWGEGDNKLANGQVRVANSNPLMLKMFHLFLKRYLPLVKEKIKMYLVLYPGIDDKKCHVFWSKMVGVALDKFTKSHYIRGRSTYNKLAHGIGTIIVSSRSYKEIIMRWLALKQKEINSARV